MTNPTIIWPFDLSKYVLNTGIGSSEGTFSFPLSMDAGSDGRIYVLDAGNSRIQVFDTDYQYITQFGSPGSGQREFDFGSGLESTDFAGSVAVDVEGYIYVWDSGNSRIQVFGRNRSVP